MRLGLQHGVTGRTIADVEVRHPRAVRRHTQGDDDFVRALCGARVLRADRRGKYLWLPLDSGDALLAHLGMSGQLLVVDPDTPDQTHLRARVSFDDGGRQLRFVDQRTFGGLSVSAGGAELPAELAHIARDPLDPLFADEDFYPSLRRHRTGLKRALLDQTVVSGIGNIYADEALWRARLHWARPSETLTRAEITRLFGAFQEARIATVSRLSRSFVRRSARSISSSAMFIGLEWIPTGIRLAARRLTPLRTCENSTRSALG